MSVPNVLWCEFQRCEARAIWHRPRGHLARLYCNDHKQAAEAAGVPSEEFESVVDWEPRIADPSPTTVLEEFLREEQT